MGSAILQGVLEAAFTEDATPSSTSSQPRPVHNFIVCTKTAASAERLKASLSEDHQRHVKVTSSQTVPVEIMQEADVVVLGFKPFMAEDVLSAREEAGAGGQVGD